MAAITAASKNDPWRRRLFVPNYQVGEAARYAGISPQTILQWQKVGGRPAIGERDGRDSLSYMQLIEVAVVAALRKAGVHLNRIRDSREYVSKKLRSEFPFAEYRFKTDGRRLFMDYEQIEGVKGKGTLIRPDQAGQLAWQDVIGRLQEFDYEHRGIVVRWRVGGQKSAVIIDPRISFGAPAVGGTPTWVIKGRWDSGESVEDIAGDFGLREKEIIDALAFERVANAPNLAA